MVDSPRTPPPVSRKVRVAGFWARGRTVWYNLLVRASAFATFRSLGLSMIVVALLVRT